MLGVPVLGPFTRSCCLSAFFCKESFWNLCVASCWSCFLFDKTLSLNCSSWFCSSFFLSSRALWRIHIHHLTTCPKNFYAPIRTPFSDTFIYFYFFVFQNENMKESMSFNTKRSHQNMVMVYLWDLNHVEKLHLQ